MDLSQFILAQYPDYLVYPTGQIYSIRRKLFLKPRYDKDGYQRFSIKNKITNKLDTIKTHQLVALKYLNHIKGDGLVVDHIDNNILNNSIHNLQLLTPLHNVLKCFYSKIKKNGLPACIFYKSKTKKYVFKLNTIECDYNIECDDLIQCIDKKKEILKYVINGMVE